MELTSISGAAFCNSGVRWPIYEGGKVAANAQIILRIGAGESHLFKLVKQHRAVIAADVSPVSFNMAIFTRIYWAY